MEVCARNLCRTPHINHVPMFSVSWGKDLTTGKHIQLFRREVEGLTHLVHLHRGQDSGLRDPVS